MSRLPWATAWIIGASSGIGAAAALQLAEAGIKVTISARSADKLAEIAARSDLITALPMDMTNPAACSAAVEQFESLPDLILLNAAIYEPMTAHTFDATIANQLMSVNYGGVCMVLEQILPPLMARKSGHIGLVASINGFVGLPIGTAYGPTKAALHNLAESIKPELDLAGITLTVVNPGFIKTPLTARNDFKMPQLLEAEDAAARMLKGLSKKRFDVIFPYPFAGIVKLLGDLPRGILFSITKPMAKQIKRKAKKTA